MIGRPPCCCSKVALASSRSSPPTTTPALSTGRHCGLEAPADLLGRQARVGRLDLLPALGDWRRSSCIPARRHEGRRGRQAVWDVLAGLRRPSFTREGELLVWLIFALEVGRVLDARHLQQDAVVALAHDGGLDGAGLVDAAAQDLDRLVDDSFFFLRRSWSE